MLADADLIVVEGKTVMVKPRKIYPLTMRGEMARPSMLNSLVREEQSISKCITWVVRVRRLLKGRMCRYDTGRNTDPKNRTMHCLKNIIRLNLLHDNMTHHGTLLLTLIRIHRRPFNFTRG